MGCCHLLWKKIFVENVQHCNLRRKTEFKKSNAETMYYGTETSIFLGPKILVIVQEDSLKKNNDFDGFKLKIRL